MTAQVMAFLMSVDTNVVGWTEFINAIRSEYGELTRTKTADNIVVYRVDTTDEDIEYNCIDNPNIVIDWDWE